MGHSRTGWVESERGEGSLTVPCTSRPFFVWTLGYVMLPYVPVQCPSTPYNTRREGVIASNGLSAKRIAAWLAADTRCHKDDFRLDFCIHSSPTNDPLRVGHDATMVPLRSVGT